MAQKEQNMMRCTLDKCRQGRDDCADPQQCEECDDNYIHRMIGFFLCVVSALVVIAFLVHVLG
jgi:hypothetical protein